MTSKEDSSESVLHENIIYADDPDTETLESSQEEYNNQDNTVVIKIENYYAVIYHNGWYIGRIIQLNKNNNCTIKFLKNDSDKFVWLKKEDVQVISRKYIFYGLISLIGCKTLKRSHKSKILKFYKNVK